MKFVLEVIATYHDIVVEAETLEEAEQIAEMGVVDRWPDSVVAKPQFRYQYYR
jgi:hypothetical protein